VKVKWKLLSLFLTALPVIAGCRDNPEQSLPKLVCQEPLYDFGEVPNVHVIEHVFALRNAGTAPLKIRRIKAGCVCTAAEVSSRLLQPSSEAALSVKLTLCGLRGHVRERVLIESNDPCRPQIRLYLQGTATADITVAPCQLAFLRIDENAEISKTIDILSNKPDSKFKVEKVQSDNPLFIPELESIENGKAYRLIVTTKPPLPEGLTYGSIRVLTDKPYYESFDIPIKADVWGDLVIAPHEIVLAPDDYSDSQSNPYVIVMPGQIKVFELRDVIPPLPSIQTNVVSLGSNMYKIELTIPDASKQLDGRGLRITTNVEGMEEILIPFRVLETPNYK
jgi:hypothetical protein